MRDPGTRNSPDRTRSFPFAVAAASLAVVVAIAYVRTRRPPADRDGAVPGLSVRSDTAGRGTLSQPSAPRPVVDFVEVGPDQYKQASAASDAEVELAITRLLREAATHAEEAAARAGTAGAYATLTAAEPELVARVDALKAEASALQDYLDLRQRKS